MPGSRRARRGPRMLLSKPALLSFALLALAACSSANSVEDAGNPDAGNDAGLADAGNDAGIADSGTPDAGSDAGFGDAGSDAGIADAGNDAGIDAGNDAGIADAGGDPGPVDAGPFSFTRFTASPLAINAGQATTLSWSVSGATQLSLAAGGSTIAVGTGASVQVHPSASTTYLLTASNAASRETLPVTISVRAATPLPLIESFVADSPFLASGSTALRWTVVNGTSIAISSLGSSLGASGAQSIAPSATTTYQLTATNTAGSAQASVTVAVDHTAQVTPVDSGAGDVTLSLDSNLARHPISPSIYGYNADYLSQAPAGTTWMRLGGNRWTAYNWETNASNAGRDYLYESDAFLASSTSPGAAMLPSLGNAQSGNAGILTTIPMQGWVSADEAGPVDINAPNISRFYPIAARKGSAFSATPDLTDHLVYADELAFVTASAWSSSKPFGFLLDNEPDLWSYTHPEIEKSAVTYRELFDKSIATSSALKDAVPSALVYGPVSYGWAGFQNLQGASDSNQYDGDFLDSYLQAMEAESRAQGRRLLDALDLHWYTEARDTNGERVTDDNNSASMVAARVQSPRSLWDSSYVESSWITTYTTNHTGIQLLPRMLAKIAASFPGTRLSISEYNHGGGDDISGAVTQADVLGIFGQQGLQGANFWALLNDESYTFGAFRAFRDYDNAGSAFGDTSFAATSSNIAAVSVYASFDAGNANRLVIVAINRDSAAHTAKILLKHTVPMGHYTVWQIAAPATQNAGSVIPQQTKQSTALPGTNGLTVALPAMSVNTIVLTQ